MKNYKDCRNCIYSGEYCCEGLICKYTGEVLTRFGKEFAECEYHNKCEMGDTNE